MKLPGAKPRVRMHLSNDTSVEGVLKGRHGGHYQLYVPRVVRADGEHDVDCQWLEIPREKVVFFEVHA